MDVDGYRTDYGKGEVGVTSTDTENPLYFGGVPSEYLPLELI